MAGNHCWRAVLFRTPRGSASSLIQSQSKIPRLYSSSARRKPPPSFSHFNQQACRRASFQQRPDESFWKRTWRKRPVLSSIAIILLGVGVVTSYEISRRYAKIRSELGNYPTKVGMMLRSALYYTHYSPDSAQAIKLFVEALQAAASHNMDPLSDEVIGIKSELTRALEIFESPKDAVGVLEETKDDCLKWVDEHGSEPGMEGARTKLLAWATRFSVKLGYLYSQELVADDEKAEKNLVWAVETALKERQRRETEGVKEGEGEWLGNDDIGSALEELGHWYEAHDKHYYAAQLFLQALMLKPDKDCHAVILMNNLATSLVQQVSPAEPGVPPSSRSELRNNAREWAERALTLARNIKPPERSEECDIGCAVATHNLGEFAEMDGDVAAARERYEEAESLAHAIGFEEGVTQANAGIRRLDQGGTSKSRFGGWWSR